MALTSTLSDSLFGVFDGDWRRDARKALVWFLVNSSGWRVEGTVVNDSPASYVVVQGVTKYDLVVVL